jgi:solute carrier family 25 (mitochondrial phosphate transporter), member 3
LRWPSPRSRKIGRNPHENCELAKIRFEEGHDDTGLVNNQNITLLKKSRTMDSLDVDSSITFDERSRNRQHDVDVDRGSKLATAQHTQPHSFAYYQASFVAGGFSSSIRWALIPLEVVKTKMQVTAAGSGRAGGNSMFGALSSVYRTDGLRGLSRGLGPTAAAYGIQTSTKYGCYELYKDRLFSINHDNDESNKHNNVWMYKMAAAGLAEATADIFMCPFEMVRVRMQTAAVQGDTKFPQRFLPALMEMTRRPQSFNGFPFGALQMLWLRQVPGTMVNFCCFESTSTFLYDRWYSCRNDNDDRNRCSFTQQLAVTFASGTVAGIVSSIISHPADSIISLQLAAASSSKSSSATSSLTNGNRLRYCGAGGVITAAAASSSTTTSESIASIIRTVGWYRLATRGLVPRMCITTIIITGQWVLYGTFKRLLLQ